MYIFYYLRIFQVLYNLHFINFFEQLSTTIAIIKNIFLRAFII